MPLNGGAGRDTADKEIKPYGSISCSNFESLPPPRWKESGVISVVPG